MHSPISCIIPFYNEHDRLLKVLKELTKSQYISEIICVDDGSTDDTSDQIKKYFSHVRVIKNSNNKGKSDAVSTGLQSCGHEVILLFDADTIHLSIDEIDRALKLYLREKWLDQLILRTAHAYWSKRLTRHDILLSGARILKRADLARMFEKYRPKRYQLEAAINLSMMRHRKTVAFTHYTGADPFKSSKIGFIRGLVMDLQMMYSIFDASRNQITA